MVYSCEPWSIFFLKIGENCATCELDPNNIPSYSAVISL